MHVEHRILVNAAPDAIYRIYEDVSLWHSWDPDTKAASLGAPLRVGSRGSLTPTKGRTVPMELVVLDPARRFTVESKMPLLRMVFEHRLEPQCGGTEVVHRVDFLGPLAVLIGPMMVRRLNSGLPVTLANLKRLAETPAQSPGATGCI